MGVWEDEQKGWEQKVGSKYTQLIRNTEVNHPNFGQAVASAILTCGYQAAIKRLNQREAQSLEMAWARSGTLAPDNPFKTARSSVEDSISTIVNDLDSHLGNHGHNAEALVDKKIEEVRNYLLRLSS